MVDTLPDDLVGVVVHFPLPSLAGWSMLEPEPWMRRNRPY